MEKNNLTPDELIKKVKESKHYTREELYKDLNLINSTFKKKLELEKLEKLEKLQKENDKIRKQNNILEEKQNQFYKFQREQQELECKYNELDTKIKKIEEFSDKSEIYENRQFEEFYDVIIKINSINNLIEGWDILMNDRGKANYQTHKTQKYVKIGVIGNENKGKSTILQKISKYKLPTGHSIKTEGLSIKYPELEEYKNLKIVLLDSAGLETPLLNKEIYNINESTDEVKNNKLNKFIEKSRDKILTEIFLQTYIIKNCDILLLVFGKLSFDEQKLLNKIKNDMGIIKRKEPLYVIHNLKEFERTNQVNNYIENTLKKSSTFNLEEEYEINQDNVEKKWKYYYEPNSYPKIYHLVYAKEGSEAGDFYNNNTINFILNKCNTITDRTPFDIINSIKDTFCLVSENILEKPLKEEDIFVDSENNKIQLKNKEMKIQLKRCLIDELGLSNFFGNGFEPKYDFYVNEKYFVINVEMPGEFKNTKIKKNTEGAYTIINITGNKISQNIDNIEKTHFFKNREFGEFSINIKLENIKIEDKKPKIEKKDGVVTFYYDLKQDEEETDF